MDGYVTLVGAEQVANASHVMRDAAARMESVASSIYSSIQQLERILNDHAERIERAMEAK